MKRRRVKITGIGPVTPAGVGREAFERGIREPVSRIVRHKELSDSFGPFVAGVVKDSDFLGYIKGPSAKKKTARHTMFAVAGAVLALTDAGIEREELKNSRTLIVTGSSLMDFGGITRGTDSVFRLGVRGSQPRLIFSTNPAGIPAAISEEIGVSAPSMVLQSSCCAGLDAIGYAFQKVSQGEADIAICGGTEAPLFRHPMLELRAAGLTPANEEGADQLCRPFDLWRTTGVVSEGCCMMVLEAEGASRREAYCHIDGYGYANDDGATLCGGLEGAIRAALTDARIRSEAVEVVSAWGPGHRLIDAAEARVLRNVFGHELDTIAVASIKGAVGNALGAAAAIQVGVAALGLSEGFVPPTVNWKYPDPECALGLHDQVRSLTHSVELVDAHGVAGMNSAMLLSRGAL